MNASYGPARYESNGSIEEVLCRTIGATTLKIESHLERANSKVWKDCWLERFEACGCKSWIGRGNLA